MGRLGSPLHLARFEEERSGGSAQHAADDAWPGLRAGAWQRQRQEQAFQRQGKGKDAAPSVRPRQSLKTDTEAAAGPTSLGNKLDFSASRLGMKSR